MLQTKKGELTLRHLDRPQHLNAQQTDRQRWQLKPFRPQYPRRPRPLCSTIVSVLGDWQATEASHGSFDSYLPIGVAVVFATASIDVV